MNDLLIFKNAVSKKGSGVVVFLLSSGDLDCVIIRGMTIDNVADVADVYYSVEEHNMYQADK